MYVKVLYDNEAKRGLRSGHGFSCFVNNKILFDSGEDSESLSHNMKRMMVDSKEIEAVVISHDHWDHTGGLWEILKNKKGIKVYACPSFSDTFKNCVKESGGKLVIVNEPMEISKNIFVTGEMKAKHKGEDLVEQSLVVNGDKGTSVITGCAHYGIVKTLRKIKKIFQIKDFYMVFGGFHSRDFDREKSEKMIKDLFKIKIEKVGPTHCSGTKVRRIFSSRYNDKYIPVKAGHIIQL